MLAKVRTINKNSNPRHEMMSEENSDSKEEKIERVMEKIDDDDRIKFGSEEVKEEFRDFLLESVKDDI